jgi:hypothetical protein
MTVLFNHANLWEFTDRNPIFGPNKGLAFGRVQGDRASLNILEVSEIQAIVAELQLRERVLLFLDIATGLRRGEMAGVKGHDLDFRDVDLDVRRSVVDQVVSLCKTETSQKRIPQTSTRHGTCWAGMPAKRAAQEKVGEMVRPDNLHMRKRRLNCSPKCSTAKTGYLS